MLLLLQLISTSIKMSNNIRNERTWIRRYKSWRNFDVIKQGFLLIQFCANKLKQKFSTFEWRNENGNHCTESVRKNFSRLTLRPSRLTVSMLSKFTTHFQLRIFLFYSAWTSEKEKANFYLGFRRNRCGTRYQNFPFKHLQDTFPFFC